MLRKSFMMLLALFFIALIPLSFTVNELKAQPDQEDHMIVNSGEASAVVIIAGNADQETEDAAITLVQYVEQSTGVRLPIKTLEEWSEGNAIDVTEIYIGENDGNEDPDIIQALEGLNGDGFFIHSHDHRLTIVGPTALGTTNGVYEFLRRFVGVRWLAPGDDWTHVPLKDDIVVTKEDFRDEPDFIYREKPIGSSGSEEQREIRSQWSHHNGFQAPRQLHLGHNLYNVFSVSKYGNDHPEFYPNDTPPALGERLGWQPCFTEEGTIDVAVDEILQYFEQRPDQSSYSLAINDGTGGFCEKDILHRDDPNKLNSMGLQDMSDIYYAWVNEVVRQVREVYPDKWFGLYAYNEVMDPPSFDIDSHVIPYITRDRMAWIDEGEREKDQQRLEGWNEAADQLGWYEGFYSSTYFVPRVYSHQLAYNLRYGNERSVIGLRSDGGPTLGDAPRHWLQAQLLWDVHADVDALLDDWYESAVGVNGAPYLKAYYDFWEDFWTERIKETDWFENNKSERYLGRLDPSYLKYITDEEIQQSRSWLELVVDKANTDEQKIRAEQILHQFEFYEASVLSYPGRLKINMPGNEDEARELLETIQNTLDTRLNLVQKQRDLIDEYMQNPAIEYAANPFQSVNWTAINHDEFGYLVDYLNEHEPAGGSVTNNVQEMAYSNESERLREFASLLLGNEDIDRSITENSSFEDGSIDVSSWNFWNPEDTARISRVEGMAATGNASILFENTRRGGVFQTQQIHPGLMASRVSYYTPPGTGSRGNIQLVFEVYNTAGEKTVFRSDRKRLLDTEGKWSTVYFLEEIPEEFNGKAVTHTLVNAQLTNVVNAQVYLDDLIIYQYQNSIHDIKSTVEQLGDLGEFRNDIAWHPLRNHLESLLHFEKVGQMDKLFKHLSSLHPLLEYQKDMMSEKAFGILKHSFKDLNSLYFDANLNPEQVRVTKPGDQPFSMALKNKSSQPLDLNLTYHSFENIILDMDHFVRLEAENAVDIEGRVHIPSSLPDGEYEVKIQVLTGDEVIETMHLRVNLSRNLIHNPGFETLENDTPLSWRANTRWQSNEISLSPEAARTGEYGLKLWIQRDRKDNYYVVQNVNLEGGKTYELSAWLKSNIPIQGFARMKIEFKHDDENLLGVSSDIFNTSYEEWEHIKMQAEAPEQANRANILLRLYGGYGGPAEAYYDDVDLRLVE